MDSAYFVATVSPGAVFRFLERLASDDPTLPDTVLLSDPAGAQHWRLLSASGSGSLMSAPHALARAFPPAVLWVEFATGRWCRWNPDGTREEGHEPAAPRLLWRRPSPPGQIWSGRQGLPWQRAISPPRIVDYVAVARLDQKGLLVEDSARLYRFSLREVQ